VVFVYDDIFNSTHLLTLKLAYFKAEASYQL